MRYTKAAPFLYKKRDFFYFSRRVPSDLLEHYRSTRIVISLKTKSLRIAQTRAVSLSSKLEKDWLTLRWRSSSDPFHRFLQVGEDASTTNSDAPLLSKAKEIYLAAKAPGRSKTFAQAAERSVSYLMQLHGDRPIDLYTRTDVNQLRDALLERGLKISSIRRTLSSIRAIVNFNCLELGLSEITSFSGVYLTQANNQSEARRKPISDEHIILIQQECRRMDDEVRWLIALISDTGMRLAEAVGLLKEDVIFGDQHPHINLSPHPWRRLKTKSSERVIPLVGSSLWAAHQTHNSSDTKFLFPKYCSETDCKANSASGALNKWLHPRLPDGCVVHSFRHSMRDRLRAVECPPDIIDRIGGWSLDGIGESYGQGYPMSVLHKWVARIELQTVSSQQVFDYIPSDQRT